MQNQAVQNALPAPETSSADETPVVQSAVQPEVQEEVKPANPNSIKKMSPMLSVVVTNELFHNGNVEAWKRIMNSYTTKNSCLNNNCSNSEILDDDGNLRSYVNNVRTKDGGTHEVGFKTALTRVFNDYAKNNGYTKTLYNRVRYIPELQSSNKNFFDPN